VYNADPEFKTMPYAASMEYSAEGEEDYVGFDHYHEDDTVDQVVGCIKVSPLLPIDAPLTRLNVRVALPDLDLVLVKPGLHHDSVFYTVSSSLGIEERVVVCRD
jgi:hypothetical protein